MQIKSNVSWPGKLTLTLGSLISSIIIKTQDLTKLGLDEQAIPGTRPHEYTRKYSNGQIDRWQPQPVYEDR